MSVPVDPPAVPPGCRVETLGVTFFDLSRFAEWASSDEDLRIASFLHAFYALAAERLHPASCRIVKFMGDAGLAVFAPDHADAAVEALCELAVGARALARGFGLDTWLNINVHVGPVVAGPFGPPGEERFDVIGRTVNIAATLGRRGVTLSPQAFRSLSQPARQRFTKVAGPVTYRCQP